VFAIIPLTGVPFLDLLIIGGGIALILWAMKAGAPNDTPDKPA
jgi:hypothetical protein